MSLSAGTRFGPYEIVGKLGAGGMGEVWRAVDTRLDRQVALKVLPPGLGDDPERHARFEREAKLLASLNHPNIAALHDVEHLEGTHVLVMELVEGEGLDELISHGPVPLADAIPIALQIAEALEAAHEKGIVHRDLKPANVKVRPDGTVKVLDFGLAKALDPAASAISQDPSLSPTITNAATQLGVILGTAGYMSPEQARGKPVDRRTDVWALGVVLFEMLAGARAFGGETVTDVIAAVVTREPGWAALPAGVGPALRRVLRRCLEKDPRRRYHDAADVALELEDAVAADGAAAPIATRRPAAARLPWAVVSGAIFVAAVAIAAWLSGHRQVVPEEAETRLEVMLPTAQRLALTDLPNLALSNDGRLLAVAVVEEASGTAQLVLRQLDRLEATPLPGTVGASAPFFSPDGRWIAFFTDGALKKVPVSGGVAITLAASTPQPRGGSWGPDGAIVYSPAYNAGLVRIPAAGGSPQTLVSPDAAKNERTYRWPDVLPNGKGVLFTIGWLDSPQDYDGADIAVYSFATGKVTTLVKGGNTARFVAPDSLVYLRAGTLYAVAFDPEALTVHGDAVPVLEGAGGEPSSGAGYLAVAGNGTLAFVPWTMISQHTFLTLVDLHGAAKRLPIPPQKFNTPRFSPDGRRLAFNGGVGRGGLRGDLWLAAVDGTGLTRLTFNGFRAFPLWSPDGAELAFAETGGPRAGLFRLATDGSGREAPLGERTVATVIPTSWSRDGRWVAFSKLGATSDIWILDTSTGAARLFQTSATGAEFSPNGRWLAYQSGESMSSLIVRQLDGDGKWQISSGIGAYPHWSARGDALFFIGNGQLMRVPVTVGSTPKFGTPEPLFGGLEGYVYRTNPFVNYDVSPDGQRFAFVESEDTSSTGARVAVALHWGDSVRRTLHPEGTR